MKTTWAVVFVLTVTLGLGLTSLIFPFGRDQGIHAFIADSMLHGKVVYRDVFNVKPPLTTAVHALALVLFGKTMTAIRLLDLLWTMATAWLVFLFVWRSFRRRWVAAAAGILYPFQYWLLDYWHTAQTDGWLNLPLAAALVLFATALGCRSAAPRRHSLGILFAGVLIGLALLLKYTVAPLPVALGVILIVVCRRQPERQPLPGVRRRTAGFASLGWLALGTVLPLVVAALVLLLSSAMPSFIESQFGLMPEYTRLGRAGVFGKLLRLARDYARDSAYRIPAVLGLVGLVPTLIELVRRRPGRASGAVLIVVWLLTALFSVCVQGKFFRYHYLPLVAPVSILGALALGWTLAPVWKWLRRNWARALLVLVTGGILFVAAGWPSRYQDLFNVISGKPTLTEYWKSGRHVSGTDFNLRDDLDLAEFLKASTAPDETVFIWGYEPVVYFLARRRTMSRFLYNFPLMVEWAPDEYRFELLREFRNDPPDVFVVAHGDQTPWVMGHNKDSFETLMEFTELRVLVEQNYEFVARVHRFDVLRWADAGPEPR